MVYHIETFAQVQQAEKGNLSPVVCGKDVVRDGNQRGFSRVTRPKSVLGG